MAAKGNKADLPADIARLTNIFGVKPD